jgi:hypothetical protein
MNANSAHAAKQQHQQVLSLCVPYTADPEALVRIALASKQARDDVVAHLQQHLPSLVDAAVTAALQYCNSLPKNCSNAPWNALHAVCKPLIWLLATAGPAAAAAPAVARVLLHVTQDIHFHFQELQEKLPTIAYDYGMRLSAEQLVAASKEQLCGMDKWIRAAAKHPAAASSSGTLWRCIMTFFHESHENLTVRNLAHNCTVPQLICSCNSRQSEGVWHLAIPTLLRFVHRCSYWHCKRLRH